MELHHRSRMIRTLHPELLDTLPAHDASAIGSRRDLRRLNTLMGHARIIANSLKQIFPESTPARVLEIGAGDGQLLLRVAKRLHSSLRIESRNHSQPGSEAKFPPLQKGEGRGEAQGLPVRSAVANPLPRPAASAPPTDVLFIDLQNLLTDETKAKFAARNWLVRAVKADIFEWFSGASGKTDVVLANLVLHHFTDAQLTLLFSEMADKTDAFIAVEPRRGSWPLFCASAVGLLGCNAVTRHDAPISVRAGFTGRELSALWPPGNEWETTERRVGLFSHLFVARRKGG